MMHSLYQKKHTLNPEQTAIILFFYLVPFAIFLIFLPIGAQGSLNSASSEGTINPDSISRHQIETFSLNIKPGVGADFRYRIYSVFGKTFDLSVMKVCFSNEDAQYRDIDAQSFNNYIIINAADKLIVPYNGTKCYELDPQVNQYNFESHTTYNYTLADETRINVQGIDLSNEVKLKKTIHLNNLNAIFLLIGFLIAWWAVCLLFREIFKITVAAFIHN